MSEKIGETQLTIAWLHETLENVTKSKSKLLKWAVNQIGIGKGYASKLIRVTLNWENQGNLPSDVVLKVPFVENALVLFDNEQMGAMMGSYIRMAHNTECNAYGFLSQHENMPSPKVYYTKLHENEQNPGVIMIEYLKDGALVNMVDGFNLEQVYAIADALARIHSKCFKNRDWISKFDVEASRMGSEATMRSMISNIDQKIKLKYHDFVEKYIEPVRAKLDLKELMDLQFDSEKIIGMAPVMVHGDFWPNNIMFKKNEEGNAGNELLAFVDFQMAAPGCCVQDLSEMFTLSCDTRLRREHTNAVVEYYYAKLTKYTPDYVPFTLEQVKKVYKIFERRSASIILFISMLEKLPELDTGGNGNREENTKIIMDRCACVVEDVGILQE